MRTVKRLQSIAPYKPGKPIEELRRAKGLARIYKLASNEIPFLPFYARGALVREFKNINRYPEGNCFYLRKALSRRLGVNQEQLVFGNGSDELIVLALRACIEKGDEVMVAYPTFLIYELQARVQGAKVLRIPLKNNRYWLEKMARRASAKTKVIFIANPDNPTGSYRIHDQVRLFLKRIPAATLVFFDEAYFEFAPPDFPKTLGFLNERGNIIIVRTFSKAYGLAGLRIGYGITTRELAGVLNTIREPFNINRMAQVAAAAALRDKTFVKKVVSYIDREKKYLYREFDALKLDYVRSATNFILVDFKQDTTSLIEYLLSRGIIIRNMDTWGLPRFFRVSVGLQKENIAFIRCLGAYLKKP